MKTNVLCKVGRDLIGQGAAEEILLYPSGNNRITFTKSGSTITTKVGTLHADGLGSVRVVTDANGLAVERTSYRPYGEEVAILQPLTLPETKGFIGERFDDASGLQYLNARYYDPKLAMFIQPDWWEVMQPGVGTNRYAYSFDDPVNGRDPSGHCNTDKSQCSDNSNASTKSPSSGGPGLFDKGGFFDRAFGGENRRTYSDPNSSLSDWARYQRDAAAYGGALGFDKYLKNTGTDLKAGFAGGSIYAEAVLGSKTIGKRSPITALTIQNIGYFAIYPELAAIAMDPGLFDYVVRALTRSGYLSSDPNMIREVAGNIYVGTNGRIRYELFDIDPKATQVSTVAHKPRQRKGEVGVTFHTHPFNGNAPSVGDSTSLRNFGGGTGLVGTYDGDLWGFDQYGY